MPNPNYIFANTINGNPLYADRAVHDAAGNDIQTTYATKSELPAAPVQSNWNESDSSSLAYIQNKPSIPAAQVNSDWTAASGVAQILHKPSEEQIVAGEGIWIHRANGNVVVSTTGGALSQVQSDWAQSDATSVAYIKHKPQTRNLVAGPGITIVDDGVNITISVTSLMNQNP